MYYLILCTFLASTPHDGPFLFEGVALDAESVYVAVDGRIWRVAASGGTAEPITQPGGDVVSPVLSPDGKQLAYQRRDLGDVFTRNLETGNTAQRTYHPGSDRPVTWTPDSRALIFATNREGQAEKLYRLALDEAFPQPLPLPFGIEAAFAPDGRLTHLPYGVQPGRPEWRVYRGGMVSPLWITDLETGATETLRSGSTNYRAPMYLDGVLYYLGDSEGTWHLYRAGPGGRDTRVTDSSSGIRHAAAFGNRIAFTSDGRLFIFEPGDVPREVALEIPLDMRRKRRQIIELSGTIEAVDFMPDGAGYAVAAGGELFRVDAEGTTRNLTQTAGMRETDVAVTGTTLACFSDAAGHYQLSLRDLETGTSRAFEIETEPSFYRGLDWSDDGRFLVFWSVRAELFLFDREAETVTRLDETDVPAQQGFSTNWAPGGRFLAWSRRVATGRSSIMIHDTTSGETHDLTGDTVYVDHPVFDASGRVLTFVSSPTAPFGDVGWSLLSAGLWRPHIGMRLSAVTLRADDRTLAQVDWSPAETTAIDFTGIRARIRPVPGEDHFITAMSAGPPGVVYVQTRAYRSGRLLDEEPRERLWRMDVRNPMAPREAAAEIEFYVPDPGTDRLFMRNANGWRVLRFEDGSFRRSRLGIIALPAPADQDARFRQIFNEAWRLARESFYDPDLHGQREQWSEIRERYARYLPNITDREQLNRLLRRMLGHLSVSHVHVSGGLGRPNRPEQAEVGLLGAAYRVTENRYRIAEVYRVPGFDQRREGLVAPLALDHEGRYILAVDGAPLTVGQNIYAAFAGKADHPVRLTVARNATGTDAETITVTPIRDEGDLRHAHRADERARRVNEQTNGRIGYLAIDAFNPEGIEDFLRGFLASEHKDGLIIDQRFNGGGITSDSLIEILQRKALYHYAFRHRSDLATPARPGPSARVLITNEWNGSAAETFAFMFQLGGLGTIVGGRTFGAGIGGHGYQPDLMGGGRLQIPNRAAFDHGSGRWSIENSGVVPDIPVPVRPENVAAGRDPQLDRAIREAMRLADRKEERHERPAYPVYK